MTNISKNLLSEKELEKLFSQINAFISKLTPLSTSQFLSELLGPEERIMISKRFAAIAMFAEGNTPYRVWQLLNISPTTAERIHTDFENGRYSQTVLLMKKDKKEYEKFWEVLEVILQTTMPPRGRGRWKSVIQSIHKT